MYWFVISQFWSLLAEFGKARDVLLYSGYAFFLKLQPILLTKQVSYRNSDLDKEHRLRPVKVCHNKPVVC